MFFNILVIFLRLNCILILRILTPLTLTHWYLVVWILAIHMHHLLLLLLISIHLIRVDLRSLLFRVYLLIRVLLYSVALSTNLTWVTCSWWLVWSIPRGEVSLLHIHLLLVTLYGSLGRLCIYLGIGLLLRIHGVLLLLRSRNLLVVHSHLWRYLSFLLGNLGRLHVEHLASTLDLRGMLRMLRSIRKLVILIFR